MDNQTHQAAPASADNPSTAGAAKPVGSIEDYAQFHGLLESWISMRRYYDYQGAQPVTEAWNKFIAYIDAWASRLAAPVAQSTAGAAIPIVLFDGLAVYDEITRKLGKSHCHSPSTVSETLGAVVRILRRVAPALNSSEVASVEDARDAICSLGEKCECTGRFYGKRNSCSYWQEGK